MEFIPTIEVVIRGFELVGVAVLVVGAVVAAVVYARDRFFRPSVSPDAARAYQALRQNLGRAIQLGLEFLIIADIIQSVAISATIESVAALGLLVLVRTFLSWSLEVEIEGEWPWRHARTRPDMDPRKRTE